MSTTTTTTTTTPNSFGVHAPEPTDRMREAVAHRDAGLTNAEVGEKMGTKPGAAGNLVVSGLRRMGREVGTTGGTTTATPVVTVPKTRDEIIAAAIEQELVKLNTARERITTREDDAVKAVDEFDPATWISEREASLQAAIDAATDALRAFSENSDEAADAELVRLTEVRDAIDITDEVAAIDAAIVSLNS